MGGCGAQGDSGRQEVVAFTAASEDGGLAWGRSCSGQTDLRLVEWERSGPQLSECHKNTDDTGS